MRVYYFILLILVFLTASAAYMALNLQKSRQAGPEDILHIQSQLQKFKEQSTPELILDLNKMYPNEDRQELIHPIPHIGIGLSQSNLHMSSSNENSDECREARADKNRSGVFDKLVLWEEFQCHLTPKLPKNFFETAPFMHPSGESYAYLAYKLKPGSFSGASWLSENVSFFHMTELSKINFGGAEVDRRFLLLSKLGEEGVRSILQRSEAVLTKKLALFKSDSNSSMGESYSVYPLLLLANFFGEKSFYVEKFSQGKVCFYRQGDLCWKQDFTSLVRSLEKTSALLLVGLIIAIGILFWVLVRKIKKESLENEKKRFALEVLTHELRTPVTNLVLQVDKLNKMYSKLSPEVQLICPILSGETYRLQRLTEETKRYLKVGLENKLVDLNIQKIASANEFVLSHISLYDSDINFTGLSKDRPIKADGYWLGLCIKNLMKNAELHGHTPIKVFLNNISSNSIEISVEDSGCCRVDEINLLTQEFFKGKNSTGIGLGLHLVKKVLREMNGSLTFQPNPTRFTITLRDC